MSELWTECPNEGHSTLVLKFARACLHDHVLPKRLEGVEAVALPQLGQQHLPETKHGVFINPVRVQGDYLDMIGCFWYLVKSNLPSVGSYTEHVTFYKVPEKHGHI